MIEKYSKFEELPEDESIMIRAFDFVSISKIEGVSKPLDLACIVGSVGPLDKYRDMK